MKKFEEELKNGPVMIDKDNVTGTPIYDEGTLIGYFNDWISPEDYEKYIKESTDNTSKLLGKINDLKDQLGKQQPEVPEVPQFVADWLDRKPLYAINGSISVEIIEWSQKQTGYADLGMNINHLLKLKVNGYTVETPKAIVTPCPVCGFEDVEANFCGICGHKNEYVAVDQIEEKQDEEV